MLKMKKITYIFILAIVFTSCSDYQKVLNKGSVEEQYKLATEMYDTGKYNKAIQLFEKITPAYRGKPQMERVQYMISDAYYNTKQYSLAAYYFDRFTKNYPRSTKKEDASYSSAYSYYLDSPIFSLDQASTKEALLAMQGFIDAYPNSDKIDDANKTIKELRYKLEKKAFETAKQYYHIDDYQAAITSFDILISDYIGTSFKEQALFYKFMASYELGKKSVQYKKEQRLKDAVKVYNRLKKSFSKSEYLEDSEKLFKKLNEELTTFEKEVEITENK
ncbi:MAG: outer membrane protein assembly factor BamD [Candidatus Azotimanducaceae bacterium]|jgi:outer membrane protein assembly factor BamD